jgi:tRNA threonylcarbamoyl adenosine modification protein (Sua5/YciO/YrdC/YwlC family)
VTISRDNPDAACIREAADVLRRGGLIAFPTETVYGLGVNASDGRALEWAYGLKGRDRTKPFTVHIASPDDLLKFDVIVDARAEKLMRKFWPGPLTIILPLKKKAPKNIAEPLRSIVNEIGAIGFRCPDHPVAQALISSCDVTVVAPSANLSGTREPVCAEDVLAHLNGKIELILDAGPTACKTGSTIVCLRSEEANILREGTISRNNVFKAIAGKEVAVKSNDAKKEDKKAPGPKKILFVCSGNSCRSPMAAGILRKMLAGQGNFDVMSAGVTAIEGIPAAPNAKKVLKNRDIDITGHFTRRLNKEMADGASLVVVMTGEHKRVVEKQFPTARGKTYLLTDFNETGETRYADIHDPVNQPEDAYERCIEQMWNPLTNLAIKLVQGEI